MLGLATGLPLSLELSKHFKVIGYDINENKINSLKKYNDLNQEYSSQELKFSNIILHHIKMIFHNQMYI